MLGQTPSLFVTKASFRAQSFIFSLETLTCRAQSRLGAQTPVVTGVTPLLGPKALFLGFKSLIVEAKDSLTVRPLVFTVSESRAQLPACCPPRACMSRACMSRCEEQPSTGKFLHLLPW